MRFRNRLAVLGLGLVLSLGCTGTNVARPAAGRLADVAGWQGAAPKSAEDFSFVVMSDRTGGHVPGEWEKAVARVNLLWPDFVICVGDLIEGYDEKDPAKLQALWDEFDGMTRKLRAPFFYCPGNHDVLNAEGRTLMFDTYVQRHGVRGQSYYSFNHRGCHFVVLDSVTASANPEFAKAMLDWLGKDLSAAASARHVFVFYHYPLWDDQKLWPQLRVLLPKDKTTIFNGHWHCLDYRLADGIPTYVLTATGAGAPLDEKRAVIQVSVSADSPRIALLPTDEVHSGGYIQDLGRARQVLQKASLGSLYRNGEPVTFRQGNPLDTPVTVQLEWTAPGCTPSTAKASLRVEPGKEEQATFTFRPSPQAGQTTLQRVTDFPSVEGGVYHHVMTSDVPLCETTEVPRVAPLADLDAVREALKDQPPRVVKSGDAKVGELRLAVAGEFLAVSARVFDPRCTAEVAEWKDCNMDLYIAQPDSATVRQLVFFPTSPKGDKRLGAYELGKELPGPAPDFAWRVVAGQPFGYEIHALVPLSQVLLTPDVKRFLVDCAVVAPLKPGDKPQFTLLYTGDPSRCAFRNNRFYALAEVRGN